MGIQDQHWYNLNANRSYPIDETASGLSDAGHSLPFGILADCILRFPTTYGRYAYLSAVAVSPHLVTLCFCASNQHPGQSALVIPDAEPSNPLLATLTVRKPITEAKHYVLTPEQPGVAGWVVFGSNLADVTYSGNFSTAAQSALLLRCGRSFTPPGVTSVGKSGLAATLSGLIKLQAGNDISITKETATLVGFGDIPDALVVRLKAAATYNVFDRYRGPCASRPESGTCRLPPLVSIGTTPFDCDGNLALDLEGVSVTPLQGGGGIVLDFGLGLSQTCARNKDLPDSVGDLPNTYSDSCDVVSSSIIDEPEPPGLPIPERPAVDFGSCCPLRPSSFQIAAGQNIWSVFNGRYSWNPLQTRMVAEDTAQANIALPTVQNVCLAFAVILDGSHADEPKPPVIDGTRMQCKITLQDGDQRNAGFVIYRQPTDITHTDLTKFSMCTVVIDHVQDAVVLSLGENPRLDTSRVSPTVPNAIDPFGNILEYFDTSYRRTEGYYISPRAYAGPFTYGALGLKLNKQYELCVTLKTDPDVWSYTPVYQQNGTCLRVEVLVRDIAAGRYLVPPAWPIVRPDLLPTHHLNCTMVFHAPFCAYNTPWGLYSDRAAALFESVCLSTPSGDPSPLPG